MKPIPIFKTQAIQRLRARVFPQVWLLCGIICSPAIASPPKAESVIQEFSELETRLLEHPTLQNLKYRSLAMQEFATATSALPDPTISLGLNNVPIDTFSFNDFLPTNKSIGIQQTIPNRGIRQARMKNAISRSASLDLAFEYEFSQLRASLVTKLIEQIKLEKEIALARQRDSKYSELQQVIRSEINAGRAVVFRLARIDIERAEVAQEIVNLQGQLAAVKAEINNLVALETNASPPPLSLIQWSGDPLEFHKVRLAMADISIAETKVDEVQAEHGPSWGLSLMYQQRQAGNVESGSSFSGDDWFSGQISFTVPIWASKKQAPALRAAVAEKAATKMNVSAIARQTESQWRSLTADREAANANIALLEAQLRALDEQIAASLITYESGTGDYAPIVDGEITRLLFESQIARQKARRDITTVKANSYLVVL